MSNNYTDNVILIERENNSKLKDIISSISQSNLSTFKNILSKIISVIENPLCTIVELQHIIELDPALALNVLRKANTAYYKSSSNIRSIVDAVMWLGIDNLRELILNQKVSQIFNGGDQFKGYSRSKLWKHSLAVAILSKLICRHELKRPGYMLYTAGLIHDVGIIAEDQVRHNQFEEVLSYNSTFLEAEQSIFSFTHEDLIYILTKSWNLPQELSITTSYHHFPFNAPSQYIQTSSILFIADYMCREIGYRMSDYDYNNDDNIFTKCIDYLNINNTSLKILTDNLNEEIHKMEDEGFI